MVASDSWSMGVPPTSPDVTGNRSCECGGSWGGGDRQVMYVSGERTGEGTGTNHDHDYVCTFSQIGTFILKTHSQKGGGRSPYLPHGLV